MSHDQVKDHFSFNRDFSNDKLSTDIDWIKLAYFQIISINQTINRFHVHDSV